jgi:hypothetical protein
VTGSGVYSDRVDGLVELALGDRPAVEASVRARGDQVLARLGDTLRAGRTPAERIDALIETYMQGASEMLAQAATGDRFEFGEAEIAASAVASAMDRAAEAARREDHDTVVAAMASAEALLDLDLGSLHDLLS